jgi:hypothetical protein
LTWLFALLAAALLFAAAGYVAAYFAYRTFKLSRLEPRPLQAPIQWTGESDARCTLLLVGDSRIARWPVEARSGWRIGRLASPEKRRRTSNRRFANRSLQPARTCW